MPGSEYVIKYISDLSEATQGAKRLEQINQDIAQTISSDYIKATRVIGTSLNKISETPIKLKGGEEAIKTVSNLGTVIQTSDGRFKEFTKTQTFIDGQLQKTSGSLKDVTSQFRVQSLEMEKATKPFLSLVGQSSQLSTNFQSLESVNASFNNELKNFGEATNVVDSGLVKVSGNTKKLEAIIETSNGKFIKLNETITKTPEGMQKISRQATDITDKYNKLGSSQETMVAKSSQLRTNFNSLSDISSKFGMELQGVGTISKVVGQNLNEVSGNTTRVGHVVQTTSGQFLQLTETTKRSSDGVQTVTRSLKDVTGQFGKTAVETAKASKNSLSLAENMGRLAKRALLTIPVWLVLRGAIMGTFKTIRDGLKAIEDQDKAWQKAKRTLQGSTQDIASNFEKLREETTKLSLETGESIEKITNAFYKFSTVGFDFETSMKGATYATKTAIVMFGDAEETANAFARAMRVLVDTSKGAKPAGEQIAEAMALTSELWKSNAFELSEFTQSLEKFAGTARATNFTTQQTIALLASLSTAGLRGGRAGTLLRSSIVKLLSNLDKLSGTLGVKVNPQLDSTFDVLMRVLDAVQGLDEGSKVAEQTANAIGKIFGGVRGMEAVLALKALREEMLKNVQTVGGIDKLNESFEDIEKTISRQITIFHNLNREIGKAFVTAVVGADDFADALNGINTKNLPILKDYLVEIGGLLNSLVKYNIASPYGSVLDSLTQIRKEQQKLFEDITTGLKGALSKSDLIDVLARIRVMTQDKLIEIAPQTIKALEQKLEESAKKLEIEPEISVNQKVTRNITIEQSQDIAKLILDVELDRLKTLGATNSQLLKAEDLYSRQLKIEETSLDKLKRKLEYEKEINNERRLQNRLGSDSIKLFEIAQTEGVEVAKRLGDVLAGETDFSTFVRKGGKELEIFKKEFEDLFKQQQAVQFFRGEQVSEQPQLRGGARISIDEDAIRRNIGLFTPSVSLGQGRAVREFQRLEELNVRVEAPINLNVELDPSKLDEVQNAFVDKVAQQLPQVGSKINKALAQALGNKQTQVL